MGVGEHHALRAKAIKVGSVHVAEFPAECLNIPIAQIVRQDDNNVGFGGR
jgi:hypothetical protein